MARRRLGHAERVRLVLALLLVAGLVVVGDRVAAGHVERRLADDLQRSQALARRPDVRIRGLPFLTQALAGEYRDVAVDATGFDLGPGLRAQRLSAVLTGAHVPPAALLGGAVGRVPVERLEARALLGFDDLERRVAPDGPASLQLAAADADDEVRVEAVVTVLGRDITLASDSRVTVEGRRLRVTTGDIEVEGVGGGTARAALEALTRDELGFAVDVGELPFGLVLRDVEVTEQGVVAVAGGEDVVLEPAP